LATFRDVIEEANLANLFRYPCDTSKLFLLPIPSMRGLQTLDQEPALALFIVDTDGKLCPPNLIEHEPKW
jgi:hypothetical protein